MCADLLWTFLSSRVKLLRQWGMTMWMYPGPSCPNRPFPEKLGDMEINTQIRRVLSHGANLNLDAGPAPLREGVDNTWISQCIHVLLQGLGCAHSAPRGITLPKDAVRWEANCAYNERL
jgi:hypothetical protein